MMRNIITFQILVALLLGATCFSSCDSVNAVGDPHFTEDGHPIADSSKVTFKSELPSGIAFFMETSGSMNGFLRANRPTDFKKDVWLIASNFGNQSVNIFDEAISNVPIDVFQRKMNAGLFVSTVSTPVPRMLETILDNVDFSVGNVAVLISDMKYDPIGSSDIRVLLTQYSTDVMNIVAKHKGIAYSLICAYSNYLDRNGQVVESKSPYYYLLIGQDRYLPYIRNCIITLLGGNYVDDIEDGFNYRNIPYGFGRVENAMQLEDGEPSFVGFDSDTCKIVLKLDLSDCRWRIADRDMLIDSSMFKISSLYGSKVSVKNVEVDINNRYNKELRRKAVASIELEVYDMCTDADVFEWTLSYPETLVSEDFGRIINAKSERDLSGSFSVNNFIRGIFGAEQNHWDETPNYILISKKQ